MPSYEITLRTDCEYATTNIVAADKNAAMAEAMRLRDEEADTLDWEHYERNAFPINEIVVRDADGNEVADWLSDEMRLSLAAPELLEALKGLLPEYESYVLSERDEEIRDRNAAWLEQACAALARAKGGAA